MQLKRTVGTISILLLFVIAGCGKKSQSKSTEAYSIEDKNGTLYCTADITHSGAAETIIIRYEETVEYDQAPVLIEVSNPNGDVIWDGIIGIPHMAWGEYYISVIDGKPCLFFYCPEESQGQIAYFYKAFYLSDEGSEIIIEEKELFGEEQEVSQIERTDFMKKAQVYIGNGDLLVSTWDGELKHWQ